METHDYSRCIKVLNHVAKTIDNLITNESHYPLFNLNREIDNVFDSKNQKMFLIVFIISSDQLFCNVDPSAIFASFCFQRASFLGLVSSCLSCRPCVRTPILD